jgi:hypothetical protein
MFDLSILNIEKYSVVNGHKMSRNVLVNTMKKELIKLSHNAISNNSAYKYFIKKTIQYYKKYRSFIQLRILCNQPINKEKA